MLKQKLRKLRRMSPAEVGSRIGEAVRRSRERQIWKHKTATLLFADQSSFDAGDILTACQELVVGTQADQVVKLQSQFCRQYTTLRNSAQKNIENLLAGNRSFLGVPVDLHRIDWHTDPKTKHRWHPKFYADISIGKDGPDVKYVWEVSRQQFLADLACGWVLTADRSAAEFAEVRLLDWIHKNPLYEGVHWTSALEASMRTVSWIWTIAGLNELGKESLRPIANALADHANYLQHHLSYFSSPFNHLIGEAVGLYLISFVLRQHPKSKQWRQLARKVLEQHTPRQFYRDGFCVEQATGYHFYTLGFLTLAVLIARCEGQPLSGIEKVVHRGYLSAASLRMPDGHWPAIGDLDSARSIPIFHQDYWQFGSLCSLAAVLFDDSSLIFDSEPGPELYWLLGVKGLGKWHSLSTADAKPQQDVLPDSGYSVASNQDDWLLFDAGPIAGGLFEDSTPSTAHGHADTLQVLYSINGTTVLGDAGIHSYSGDADWVNYFRSPAAHNTFEVQGVPVAKVAGKLAWSNVVAAPKLSVKLCDDVWLMRGNIDLSAGVTASRYIFAIPGAGVWIADWIESDVPRDVTWYWQLGACLWQKSHKNKSLHLNNDQGVAANVWSYQAIDNWQIIEASDNSPVGWKATEYGSLRRGNRLSIRLSCEKHLLSVTHFGREESPISLESLSIHGLTVDCQAENTSPLTNTEPQAEVIWRFRDLDGTSLYFADLAEEASNEKLGLPAARLEGLLELDGIGDWPIFVRHSVTEKQKSAPTVVAGSRNNQ